MYSLAILCIGGLIGGVVVGVKECIKENYLMGLGILGAILCLALIFLLFPRKKLAKRKGYTYTPRTVGKRSASVTFSPNYNGTSYSGSIDWGDPGDTSYTKYEVFQLLSGKEKEFLVCSGLSSISYDDSYTAKVEYGVLTYNLLGKHSFVEKTQSEYETAKNKVNSRNKKIVLFLQIFMPILFILFYSSYVIRDVTLPPILQICFIVSVLYYSLFFPVIEIPNIRKELFSLPLNILISLFSIGIFVLYYFCDPVVYHHSASRYLPLFFLAGIELLGFIYSVFDI
jgi:hypothetical protein